jgi:hypothetical protein
MSRSVDTYTRPARVVNIYKDHFDVYCGRAGKGRDGFWGNPFSYRAGTRKSFLVDNRKEAISQHKLWVPTQLEMMRRLPELAGQRLGCFCKPADCHCDTYLDLLEEMGYPVIRD